jgi:acetamidase/formamidase
LLAEQRKLPADESAALVAKVADCRVTQVVDIKKGIHCITSKDAQKSLAEPRPSAETPEYPVTYAVDADINKAMDAASWSMIELLQKERSLSRLDAYSLASEIEAAEKGVHCLVPKSLWVKR